jgi:hypothetical protein
MAAVSWPPTLPQLPNVGFGVTVNSPVTRFAVDKGPERVRRDGLRGRKIQRTPMELTGAQLTIFRQFWQDSLFAGTQRFNWIDFETGTAAECRFTREPQWNNDSPASDPDNYVFVSDLEMEVFG